MFGNLFGGGRDRPPAPEVASPEDVEQYNLEFAKARGMVPDFGERGADRDPEQAPFAKQDAELARNVKHKAEFPWLYDPSRGVRWDFDPIALRNLSQTNTWVGMLVQSITKELAETPWTIVKADGRTETQKRLATHPEERTEKAADGLPDATAETIHDLLMRPNPDDTWQDLVEMWMGDLLEIGSLATVKAFHRSAYEEDELVADPRTIEPLALVPTAPEVWTKDYSQRTSLVEGYWQFDDHRSPGAGTPDGTSSGYRAGGSPDFFDAAEMMWSDMTPRTNRRYGIPPTLIVQDFLQSLDMAISQEQEYLSRGSIPSGAWVFENWDREQLKERKEEMRENVKGKPHKSLMFAGQQGDVKFEPMSMNFQELEFTDRMKWYARVVASAFQVPTAVVGIEPERVNYNTFQGERENFESNTLGPYLQKLERVINMDLIRPHWGAGSYRFEFKPGMSESTRAMISERVSREFSSGIRRRNEARREIGLDPVDEEFDGFQDEVVEDTSPEDAIGDLMQSADADAGDDEGNPNESVRKDDPLRNTDDWMAFDVQPADVEALTEAINDDVREVFEEVLADEEIERIIDRLAVADTDEGGEEETVKSLSALSRRLREIFTESDVVARIQTALREQTAQAARETVEETLAEASDVDVQTDIDVEAIEAQLADREVTFADRFAEEMKADILDTVGDGWAEGRGTREIAADIADQADINEGWTGAERIARQETHMATGLARREVAAQLDKVEVWKTSGDNRVRDAHEEMEGKWVRPSENWEVEYENNVVVEERTPGDSEQGIGCRCTTLLRDIETVDASDHAGT